jgi:hypothetical protein
MSHNKELCDIYRSSSIIKVVKSGNLKQTGQTYQMEETNGGKSSWKNTTQKTEKKLGG